MRKRIYMYLFFLLLSIGVLIVFLFNRKATEKVDFEIYKIEKQADFLFYGIVESDQIQEEFFDTTVYELIKMHVSHGQNIRKGTPLFTYRLRNIESSVSTLEYSVKKIQLSLNNLNLEKNQISQEINELKNKDKTKLSNIEIQELDLEIRTRKSNLEKITQQIIMENLSLEEAEKNLKNKISDKETTIVSTVDGIVDIKKTNVQNSLIISIYSESTHIKSKVSEFEYSSLNVGDTVKFKLLNSLENHEGTVIYKSYKPIQINENDFSMVSYYDFKISLSSKLQLGNRVQITIPNNKVIIPINAVKQNAVEVNNNGKLEKREVKGVQKNGYFEVESGLQIGDEIRIIND